MQSRARFGAFQLPVESNGEFGDLPVSMFANPGLPDKKQACFDKKRIFKTSGPAKGLHAQSAFQCRVEAVYRRLRLKVLTTIRLPLICLRCLEDAQWTTPPGSVSPCLQATPA